MTPSPKHPTPGNPFEDFLADAIHKAEQAAHLCTRIEPPRITPEDMRHMDAALDLWLARRGLGTARAA
jgi:hypothetical protein